MSFIVNFIICKLVETNHY